MKKILFGQPTAAGGNAPFWQPWGFGGWLARLLGFLVLLFALLLLLSLFKKQQPRDDDDDDDGPLTERVLPDSIVRPRPPIGNNPIDTTTNVRRNIDNPGENLPPNDSNYIHPIDSTDIIERDHRQIVRNRLNVLLDSDASDDTFNKWSDEFKALYPSDDYKVTYYDPLTKLMQIEVPEDQRETLLQQLPQQITDIQFKVFPEGLLGPLAHHPNDPIFQHQEYSWYYDPIQVFEAWDITMGSPNVTLAICDTYFDLEHDELNSDRIVKPYSIWRRTGNVAPAEDAEGSVLKHGSMVASMALGNIDNERGSAGIAPLVKFMPISMGSTFTSMTMAQGVLYAIYQGANVVNISAGTAWPDEVQQLTLDEQIEFAQTYWLEEQAVWDWINELANRRNVTIVWAAGNENIFTAMDASKRGPATIKVSAVDPNLRKAEFSNFGNFAERDIDESTVSGPGVDIFGAMPYNSYDMGGGTSYAAPIVAGTVALMKSLDPTLTTQEIIRILRETGKPVQGCPTIGPLIQVRDALLKVKDNFANFDDIMRDHSKLIGLWRSTTLLLRTTNGVQHPEDEVRLYFDVKSESEGQHITCEVRPHDDYTAPFTIEWGSDKFIFHQPDAATCPGRDRQYNAQDYILKPDPSGSGQLMCSHLSNGREVNYFLRKVEQREDE